MRWPCTRCISPTRCVSPGREIPELPSENEVTDRELSMAQLLIESMESDWDPERFHDTHRQKVEALIEEKRSGHEIVIESGPEQPAKVIDLMEALNASIAAAGGGGTKATKKKPAAKKAATRPGRTGQEEPGQEGTGQSAGPYQDGGPPQGILILS